MNLKKTSGVRVYSISSCKECWKRLKSHLVLVLDDDEVLVDDDVADVVCVCVDDDEPDDVEEEDAVLVCVCVCVDVCSRQIKRVMRVKAGALVGAITGG